MKKCSTKYCKNKTSGSYCSTCRSRKSRQANVIRYTYNNLKSNSLKRGKEFTLTYTEFINFCSETKYIQGKGKSKQSFSIDRIENERGYTADNIIVLTLSDNSRKGTKRLDYDWQTGTAYVITSTPLNNVDNLF